MSNGRNGNKILHSVGDSFFTAFFFFLQGLQRLSGSQEPPAAHSCCPCSCRFYPWHLEFPHTLCTLQVAVSECAGYHPCSCSPTGRNLSFKNRFQTTRTKQPASIYLIWRPPEGSAEGDTRRKLGNRTQQETNVAP